MRNPLKLWWRHIRGPWTGYRVPATPFENYVIGRSKLFFLKSRYRLHNWLKAPPLLAPRLRTTVKRKARRSQRLLRVRGKKAFDGARRHLAQVDRRLIRLRYEMQSRVARRSRAIISAVMIVAPVVSFWLAPTWQDAVGAYFNPERFAVLRSLLSSTGGALVGATAIGFSVVMVAVQLNFARMPHGLFRRLTSDPRLLGAFAATFLLGIGVSALSLMPDASWVALALTAAAWGTLLILYLFLHGYWRALHLLNPAVQLGFISEDAQKDLQRWSRRAERLAPLLPFRHDGAPPKLDLRRLAFYKANPQWTVQAKRAVAHAISFARRYAEQNDFEVSGLALRIIVAINLSYIAAKGKTFVASNPIFDIPDASDAFINDALEHLRRLARISTSRQSEEGTRQVLATMAALAQVYLAIDYSAPGIETKEHSQLAASYLTGAVEAILPTNSPDLIMEGVRLIGSSARGFLAVEHPKEMTTLASKIGALSIMGVVKPEYRPVTLTAMCDPASDHVV
jgi:hypothetical protein